MEPGAAREPLTQLRRGVLEFCVLSLLARHGRSYAYDLVRGLAEVPGMATSEGTVYPLLSRLRRAGLVETDWSESASGPPRRYYRLAPAGRTALDAFRTDWHLFRRSVDALLEDGTP